MSVATRLPAVPEDLIAEAGVWIARLHGPQRDESMEQGFRQWMRTSPDHARAFELASGVWDDAQLLSRVAYKSEVRARRPFQWKVTGTVVALCASIVVAVVLLQSSAVTTRVGEQRSLTLEDGSRVFMNTDTRISEHYDESVRRITLLSGEALFEVAKQTERPFIVVAGERQVRALGTSFVVRYEPSRAQAAVTLVEGKVSVSATAASEATLRAPVESSAQERTGGDSASDASGTVVVVLSAGERATFAASRKPVIDRPSLDKATAWRRGQVSLDEMPLAAAAAEMNRYNTRRLVIDDPQAAALPINGLFQAGDSESFAHAVAEAYGLDVVAERDRIVIRGAPRPR